MMEKDHTRITVSRSQTTQGSILLLAVIIIGALFSLSQRLLLDFRAGHMDEYDYLFVGKSLLQGLDWPTYTYIFGADFNWYLLGSAEHWLGGLTGARVVAAVLGLLSLIGVYLLGITLWQSRLIAICATLLLAVNSGHIFISKIATYDALNFTLFTLALTPLIHGAGCSRMKCSVFPRTVLMALGSLLMLFAALAKYTTLVYLPFVALALLIFSLRSFLIFTAIIGIGLVIHAALHWDELKILYEVQIIGTHGNNATYTEIIARSLNHTWLLLVLSMVAILRAGSNQGESDRRTFYITTALLLFSFPLFAYHLQGRNLISLYKHLNFANLFLSLSAAWLLVQIAQPCFSNTSRFIKFRMPIIAIFISLYLIVNYIQLQETQRGFPDVTSLLQHLKKIDINANILSEDPYLFRYHKFGQMSQKDISETTWLDNDMDGKHTIQDVKDAVWDRKFGHILLTDAIHPEQNKVLRQIMKQRGYSLQFDEPYALSNAMTTNTKGNISLYKRDILSAEKSE